MRRKLGWAGVAAAIVAGMLWGAGGLWGQKPLPSPLQGGAAGGGSGSGTVTSVATTAPITGGTFTTSGTIGCAVANTSTAGCLASADWNTFNGKQAALGYTAENTANKDAASGYAGLTAGSLLKAAEFPAFTGDCTTSSGAVALTCGSAIGRTANPLSQFASTTSAQLLATLSNPTGTGLAVFNTSPTFVTPVLGTPASGTLTNLTGLPPAGVVGTAAILGANSFTANQTTTINALGVTPADGHYMVNTTAAAVNAQQISPSLHQEGSGWKTTATAGPQVVDYIQYLLPIQGTANPSSAEVFCFGVNAGAYSCPLQLNSSGLLSYIGTNVDGWIQLTSTTAAIGANQFNYFQAGATYAEISNGGVVVDYFTGTLTEISNTGVLAVSSTTAASGTADTGLSRDSAGIWDFGTGAQGSTAGGWKSIAGATVTVLTASLKTCTATTGVPWRASVSDATAPALGVALTGGGSAFANVHCSLTTGTYLVDGI